MIPKVRAAKARGKKLGGLRPGTLPRIEAIRAKADSDAKMAMMAIGRQAESQSIADCRGAPESGHQDALRWRLDCDAGEADVGPDCHR